MAETNPSFKVIIIGSGLAGSLLANGLIRNNVNVRVYERMQKEGKREGYQIRLGAPCFEGFRACLDQDTIDKVVSNFGRAEGAKAGAPVVYDKKFNALLDLSKFPTYHKSAPVNRGVLRDTLASPVYAAGKLNYASVFSRYEILNPGTSQERVRVWFADETHDDCDVLIGADGSHSKVNKQLGLNNLRQIQTHISFIAKNDLPTKMYMTMSPIVREKPIITFAERKSIYFCAYLPNKLDAHGTVSQKEIDDSLSSSMFGIHVPVQDCPSDIFEQSLKEQWNFISTAVKGWAKEYHEVIDLVKGSDLYVYKARSSERPSKNWRANARSKTEAEPGHPRVWLLGDAMHAMLPNRGQGGNQSMRDTATVLPLLLQLSNSARAKNQNESIAKACKSLEAEMIPRAFAWVQKSGGTNMMPVDSSKISGRIFFSVAAVVMNLAFVWYSFVGLFVTRKMVNDVPEFKD